MDNQKQELITKLKEANNILVTVSANPSVDQLAACIGLTLLLNKLKKHATAVFSGQVPSTLQFLKPEETLEKNTDSLRDFIVSLDKSKADKLRYKVEDNVVKIFITPYKTSITQDDLDFSQGDFNVDVVVCLGVDRQQDLDQAIISHGRILHDATVASVSIGSAGELGTVNWVEPQASSLSELTAQIADALGKEHMDGQIATSFLTGIVAETDRFSNEKTSPVTMQLSAQLMAAGANQQLVASELQSAATTLAIDEPAATASSDGTLEIGHNPDVNPDQNEGGTSLPPPTDQPPQDDLGSTGESQVNNDRLPDEPPSSETSSSEQPATGQTPEPASRMILQPPSMGGALTANSTPESFDPSVDPLTLLNRDTPMLSHNDAAPTEAATDSSPMETAPVAAPESTVIENVVLPDVNPVFQADIPAPPAVVDTVPEFETLPSEPAPAATLPEPSISTPVDAHEKSLAELEASVGSPHLNMNDSVPMPEPSPVVEPELAPLAEPAQPLIIEPAVPVETLDEARDAVMAAVNGGPQNSLPQPTQAVGAEGYLNVQDILDTTTEPEVAHMTFSPAPQELTIPTPDPVPPTSVAGDVSTAPPVPPPLPLDDMTKFTAPQ